MSSQGAERKQLVLGEFRRTGCQVPSPGIA
jgi:hypothetical protein